MNGHDLKPGMRVRALRCVFVLGKEYSSKQGTVEQVGPSTLGAMPSWALVNLDNDADNPHRFNVWELIPVE